MSRYSTPSGPLARSCSQYTRGRCTARPDRQARHGRSTTKRRDQEETACIAKALPQYGARNDQPDQRPHPGPTPAPPPTQDCSHEQRKPRPDRVGRQCPPRLVCVTSRRGRVIPSSRALPGNRVEEPLGALMLLGGNVWRKSQLLPHGAESYPLGPRRRRVVHGAESPRAGYEPLVGLDEIAEVGGKVTAAYWSVR
jgi:hypothetical protein